ncbi:MAG: carboxylesterase family protein, partial [Candidatus Binatia bacterium]
METIVETGYGKLQGIEKNGIHVFRGIPYARAPVGQRRFHAAEPPERWPGVRDATRFAPAALQNVGVLGPMLGLDMGALA